MRKRLRCYLGFHKWDERVSEGQSYLTCRYCGKYSDKAASVVRYGRRQ
jgi:hypothetical protein